MADEFDPDRDLLELPPLPTGDDEPDDDESGGLDVDPSELLMAPPGAEPAPAPPPGSARNLPVAATGNAVRAPGLPVDFVKELEGWNPRAYGDFRQTSIGYGTKARHAGEVIDQDEGERRLGQELAASAARVDITAKDLGVPLTGGMRDALISFDFNTGEAPRVLERKDPDAIASHMLRYTFATDGGQKKYLPGLANRRQAEVRRFFEPEAPAAEPEAKEPDFVPERDLLMHPPGFDPDKDLLTPEQMAEKYPHFQPLPEKAEGAVDLLHSPHAETPAAAEERWKKMETSAGILTAIVDNRIRETEAEADRIRGERQKLVDEANAKLAALNQGGGFSLSALQQSQLSRQTPQFSLSKNGDGALTLSGTLDDPEDSTAGVQLTTEEATIRDETAERMEELNDRLKGLGQYREPNWNVEAGRGLNAIDTAGYQALGSIARQGAGVYGLIRSILGGAQTPGGIEESMVKSGGALQELASGSTGAGGVVARGAGNVAALAAANPSGIGGLLAGAGRAGAETYERKLEETGGDEHEARKAALKSSGEMLVYLGAGKVAGMGAAGALGKSASTAAKTAASFVGATGANIAAGSLIAALEAPREGQLEALKPTVESATEALLWAAVHAHGEFSKLSAEGRQRAREALLSRGWTDKQVDTPFVAHPDTGKLPDLKAPSVGAEGEKPAWQGDESLDAGEMAKAFGGGAAPSAAAPAAAVVADEEWAKRHAFPKGLIGFVQPDEAAALEKAGTMADGIGGKIHLPAMQALMRVAAARKAAAETATSAATPADKAPTTPAPETAGAAAPAKTEAAKESVSGGPKENASGKQSRTPFRDQVDEMRKERKDERVEWMEGDGRRRTGILKDIYPARDQEGDAYFADVEATDGLDEPSKYGNGHSVRMENLRAAVPEAELVHEKLPAPKAEDPHAIAALADLNTRLDSKDAETRRKATAELMLRSGVTDAKSVTPEQVATMRDALRETVQDAEAAATERDAVDNDHLNEATATAAEDMPFSLTDNSDAPHEVEGAARATVEQLGAKVDVEMIGHVDEISSPNARKKAQAQEAAGKKVGAMFIPGTLYEKPRVVIHRGVVKTKDAAVKAVLHEVAGHGGLRALFAKVPAKWAALAARIWEKIARVKFQPDQAKKLGYANMEELGKLYGHDAKTESGREALVDEHLARLQETGTKPGWWSSAVGAIKDLLRTVTGGKLFKTITDGDLERLLWKAKKAAGSLGEGVRGAVKFSLSDEGKERMERAVTRALEASKDELNTHQTAGRAKADPSVSDPVKAALNGVYAIYGDEAALRDARSWIEKEGADGVERTLLDRTGLDKRDIAAAKLLLDRHSAAGADGAYAALLNNVIGKMNTQAQAMQAMHLLFDTSTPEGALSYVQREVAKAVAEAMKNHPELKAAMAEVEKLRDQLEKMRKHVASGRILEAQRIIDEAGGLTPERKVELNHKLLAALTSDDRTDATKVRVRGLLEAAGMSKPKAAALADSLVNQFRTKVQKARDAEIKKILQVPAVKKVTPKGDFEKLEKLNAEGKLDDTGLHAAIAKRFKLPTFTPGDAKTVKGFFADYHGAKDAELKLVQAAKLMNWVGAKVHPAGLWDKVAALYKLTKLMSFKTTERNVLGNVLAAVMDLGIDVPKWAGRSAWGLLTGKGVARFESSMGRLVSGNAEAARIYRMGREFAVSKGASGWQSFKAGMDTLLTAARMHTNGINDARQAKAHRTVFTSTAGRMFENFMGAMLSLPDVGRFYGERTASLARQMKEAGPGVTVPTSEMYEQAYLEAQRAIWTDDNSWTRGFDGIVKGINKLTGSEKFGIGTVLAPFVRIPVNIFRAGLQWSPLGFVRGLYEATRGRSIDPKTGRPRATTEQAVDSLLKAAVGTGAMIPLGSWLYGLGIITAGLDEDEDIAALQRASGYQKYAINWSMLRRRLLTGDWHSVQKQQEGDTMISYAWAQPAAMPLAAGAELARRAKSSDGSLPPWWVKYGSAPAGAAAATFLEQPMVMGLNQFAGDLSLAHRTGNYEYLARVPLRALDFVPAIVRDARYLSNNNVGETRTADVIRGEIDRMIGGIPGVNLPQRYDVLGKAEERYQAGTNTWANVLFNPTTTMSIQTTAAGREAMRLWEATGNKSVAPRSVDKSVQINATGRPGQSKKMELTTAEMSKLQQLTGRLTVRMFEMQMANPRYAQMSDAGRAKLMARHITDANTAAKVLLFGHKPYTMGVHGAVPDKGALTAIAIAKAAGLVAP